jgi:hypothetical protein
MQMQKACTRCNALFDCGATSPTQTCWCMALPKIEPTGDSDCLCPVCLKEEVEKQKIDAKQL